MEEVEKIQKYIIQSTPYGQLSSVVQDIDKLLPIDLLSPSISNAIQQYCETHLALFSQVEKNTNKKGQFLVMESSKIKPGQYVDQLNNKIITVDYLKGQILKTEQMKVNLEGQGTEILKKLSTSLTNYLQKYYKQPNSSQVYLRYQPNLEIYAGFTSKNTQLSNFYSGEWISSWKISENLIEGKVILKSHFFESGNIQFNQVKNFKQQFKFSESVIDTVRMITEIIEQFEGKVQQNLNKLYCDFSNSLLKNLRRVTPLTKSKMSWNLKQAHLNKDLIQMNK